MEKNGRLVKEQFQHFSLTGEKEKLFSSKKIYMHEDCCPKPLLKDGRTIHFQNVCIFWFWPQWAWEGQRKFGGTGFTWIPSEESGKVHCGNGVATPISDTWGDITGGIWGDAWWQMKPEAPTYVLISLGDSLGTDVDRSCLVLQHHLKDTVINVVPLLLLE